MTSSTMTSPGRLQGKIAIVTGAAAGIGAATARLFAREGAHVVIADLDGAGARSLAEAIGPGSLAVEVDVGRDADARKLVATAVERFGGLDILVNNAGRGVIGTVETTTEDDWDALMTTNLKSVFLCSKHAVPVLRARGGGAIVNTASNVATIGIRDRAAYVASKGGVAALTKAMALDHVGDNIRVNCVAPGVIGSSYFDKMLATVPDPAAFKAGLEARAPMSRMGRPEEIASAILWLASSEASFATGAMFTVDGGMTAW